VPGPAPNAFAPARLGTLTLRNRIIKAATFEGMCPEGTPSPALTEHHRRIAAGGAGLTTVAYCSVSPDGRSYSSQMWMREALVEPLSQLTAAVHAEGGAASLQLGHCGSFADRGVIGGRPLAPSVCFNTYGLSVARAMTQDDMERVASDFAQAALRARKAGFDAVELHLGHGYLLSQFLSPWSNRRRDAWGGSLEGRLRFPLAVVEAVRQAVGADFPVLAKLNLTDGFSGGLEVRESIQVAQALEGSGIDAIVMSGGFVSRTPLYMLRGAVPLEDMVAVQDRWVRRVGLRLFGSFFVTAWPWKEVFFLEEARRVREACAIPLVLLGGVRSRAQIEQAMADGFDFVGMGRPLLHDPELVNHLAAGTRERSACEPCNRCIAEMDRGGVRCVLPDAPGSAPAVSR